MLSRVRAETGDYLLATHDTAPFATNSLKVDELLRTRKLNKAVYLGWKTNLASIEKTNSDLFAPWFAFAGLPSFQWADKAPPLAKNFAADTNLNPLVAGLFVDHAPTNLVALAAAYDGVFGQIPTNDDGAMELRQFEDGPRSPENPPRTNFASVFLFDNTVINKIQLLKSKLVDVEATDPGAPARAMVLEDKPHPADSRIFLRGNPATPGAPAPRQFLEVLSPAGATPFPRTCSGRLQLAEDIASPDNPLTARVFVNRVWMHHFDAPLVATPSDFGVRTPRPVHAKLLDYLAARFVADGWSVKKLHRLIMLSSVYQQGSEEEPPAMKVDPDNNYLWRMNPRRLDFEAMRDSLLFVAGQLDKTMGGQPADLSVNTRPARRTVYGLVDRQNLPEFFRAFDFASPDASSAGQFETIVAPQALFLLNSPLLAQCARDVAARGDANGPGAGEARIRQLYEILFQRQPTRDEIELGRNYIANQPAHDAVAPEPAAWEYGWGTFNEQSSQVEAFNPLSVFVGSAWRAKKSDAKIGFVQLTATGGNAGRTNFVVIRRWNAPRDGVISITGLLTNSQSAGQGLRGRIVSSRLGLLGQWRARNSHAAVSLEGVAVKAGDAIDFMVDSLDGRSGAFQWAPRIEMAAAPGEEMGLPHVWNARENFIDPKKMPEPLGAWAKYAQVLLFSNEFFFIE